MRLFMTVLQFLPFPFPLRSLGSAACVYGVPFHRLITQPPGALSLSEDVTVHTHMLSGTFLDSARVQMYTFNAQSPVSVEPQACNEVS